MSTYAGDVGEPCEERWLVREGVRAVRPRPVISPDNLLSGVYTSRRAARWATEHGGASLQL